MKKTNLLQNTLEREIQDLLAPYPDPMGRTDFRKACRIGTRTSIYLLQSGLVPCENTGKQTRCYKIAKADVAAYHDSHGDDKEVLVTIRKAVDASPELRSKKQLIEAFILGINDVDDVLAEWHDFVAAEREKELAQIIQEEKLKEPETRKFLENAFRDGEIKTTGTDIDKLLPPVSRFGGDGARAKKKQTVIDKLKAFFERFFGIGEASFEKTEEEAND